MHSGKSLLCLAALLCGGLASSALAQTTVYSNDFLANADNFSVQTRRVTPGTLAHPADVFLGEFGNSTDTLTLTGLAPHTTATVSFDVYFIRSWDGDGPFGGAADHFGVTANSVTLLNSTFANYPGN